MTRAQFLRRLRKFARANNVEVDLVKARGKGSHYTAHCGKAKTTLHDSDYSPAFVTKLLKQLGIDPKKF